MDMENKKRKNMKKGGRGLFLGRFQPFHKGHVYFIEKIIQEVDELIIGICFAQYSYTLDNPFTAGERVEMIWRYMETNKYSNYLIIPINYIENNGIWVKYIKSLLPFFNIAYTNNPLAKLLLEEEGIKVKGFQFKNRIEYKGSEIRKRMIENKPWEHLVPKEVADYIKEIKGVYRLVEISKKETKKLTKRKWKSSKILETVGEEVFI